MARLKSGAGALAAQRRHTLKTAARLGAMAMALPLIGGLAGCDRKGLDAIVPSAAKFNGVDITGADYAKDLRLPDTTGRVRSLQEFRGKVVIVFFGFTQCPEICPTTMTEIAELRRRLGPDADRVQGVFVSIDPERDTPEVLGAYIKAIDPTFVGLRGTVDQVTAAARDFKVFFQKVPSQDGKSYTMDHTAGSYVFDPKGQVRLFSRYGTGLDALLADVKLLLQDKG